MLLTFLVLAIALGLAVHTAPVSAEEDDRQGIRMVCLNVGKGDAVLNDYSLAEVAEDLGISRQGVHDLVKRTRQALAGYEEKLHLVQKFIRIRDNVNRIQKMTEDEGIRKLTEEILEEL